jgi:hypothetical protein
VELGGGNIGGGGDSLVEKIIGELPRTGVAVALGRAETEGDFDKVSAMEMGLSLRLRWKLSLGFGGVVGEECSADAASDGNQTGGVRCDVFDGGE